MSVRWRCLSIAAIACVVSPVSAQHMHGAGDPHETPAALMSGMGSLHHPIATSNPEAQKFFDQGLTLVYAFNHHEAARSFQRAAELDPRSPMPYWGIALAVGPNYNDPALEREKAAYDAILKALALAASAPENERAYVDALAKRFTNDPKPDFDKLGRDYAAAMRGVSRRYPDDPDAATLFAESLMVLHAWQLWANDGQPGENTPEIVATLEGVLRRWPDHAGANHLYVHALEASPNPERALASARRLRTLAPSAAHLVHMPAHIYYRAGDYAAAVRANQEASAVDDQYLRTRSNTDLFYVLMYAHHNFHFLAAAAMMDGEFDTAYKAARDLESAATATAKEMAPAEAYLPTPLFVLLRFGRWDDILAQPEPSARFKGLKFFWSYARGCALAAKGQGEKANAERNAMEATYSEIPAGPAFEMLFNDWRTLHDLAVDTLDARIAAARGNLPGAIEHLRAAVAVQDKMNYNEPPDWYYPVRESLGAALLRNGQTAEAEAVFREDLHGNPRNPRSLFGLWKSLDAQKKTVDADWVKASFGAAWKGSPDGPRLTDF